MTLSTPASAVAPHPGVRAFPADFRFGVATAAFQNQQRPGVSARSARRRMPTRKQR